MTEWACVGGGILLLLAYEAWTLWSNRARPGRMARATHALMRVEWAESLAEAQGTEVTAVQALRNSLMSATIAASTSALALMGTVSLAGPGITAGMAAPLPEGGLYPVHLVLQGLLLFTLFASWVCSSTAMRYFNHAGFAMSMPVGSPERARWMPLAAQTVLRAGLFYSWGLRSFLLVAPLVAGILQPWMMLPASAGLVLVLNLLDRALDTGEPA